MKEFFKKNFWLVVSILFLSFANYSLAVLGRDIVVNVFEGLYPILVLSVLWMSICAVPTLLMYQESGFSLTRGEWLKNWKELLGYFLVIFIGLVLFVLLGVTKQFHSVRSPIFFFFVTPFAEELLFRGWIFGQLKKLEFFPVTGSALLFSLHHLQYFGYVPTSFALLQIAYTFLLGILLGRMRLKSGNLYFGLGIHILINLVIVYL